MATTRRARATRRRLAKLRDENLSARRLIVTVTAPDGAEGSSRGLALWLTGAAPKSARGEVTIALISDGRMRTLNRSFRGKDYATDVLSFPAHGDVGTGHGASAGSYLGDVVIAIGIARRQAHEAGHPVSTELKILALHGLLHLLGYDHETDKGTMARLEATLRKKAGLEEGLIARTVAPHRAKGHPSTQRPRVGDSATARRGPRRIR